MTRKVINIQILVSLLFFGGCASVQPSGYLDNYASLSPKAGLKKVASDPKLQLPSGKVILVQKPKLHVGGASVKPADAERYAVAFTEKLSAKLRDSELFRSVSSGTDVAAYSEVDYVLETYIARLRGGNGFLRWFFGFGAGASDVQIEGKLIDRDGGEVVMEFADRRRETGNPFLGLNVTAFSNDRQIKRSIDNIAKSIVKYLEER